MFLLITLVLNNLNTPLYYYTGVMYPPTLEWGMFAPYTEYIVNGQICRAHRQPNCTWWNAMHIEELNTSINSDSQFYYGVKFDASGAISITVNKTETACLNTCYTNNNCTGAIWSRLIARGICFHTQARNLTIGSTQLPQITKIPDLKWYIRKQQKRFKSTMISHMHTMLDTFDCRLNSFRCPPT